MHRSHDGHVHCELARDARHLPRGVNTLRDVPELREYAVERAAACEREPDAAVARQVAGAREDQIPEPGKPTGLKVNLGSQGEIELKWKCKNPKGSEGTMYEIRRKIGDGPFIVLGTAGKKQFVDETIPAGTASAIYSIRAFRSTRRGALAQFNVYLGIGDGYVRRHQPQRNGKDPAATQLTVRAE